MKRCTKCGEEKPRGDFSPHGATRDGFCAWCKSCNNAATRARRSSPKVRAQLAAARRARREDPAIAERDRQKSRAWKARNPERAAASYNNPRKREQDRLRRATVEGLLTKRLNEHRRRARKAGGKFTPADWQEVLEAFQHRCGYCLRATDLEIEHVQPLSRDGLHSKENIVPACRSCNSRKGVKTLLHFLLADAA